MATLARVTARAFSTAQAQRNVVHQVKSWPEIFHKLMPAIANRPSYQVGLNISSRAVVRVTDPVFTGPTWNFLQRYNQRKENVHASLFFLGNANTEMQLRSEELPALMQKFSLAHNIYPQYILASGNPLFSLGNAPEFIGGDAWSTRREDFLRTPDHLKPVVVYVESDPPQVEQFHKLMTESGSESIAFQLECPPDSVKVDPDILKRLHKIFHHVKTLWVNPQQEDVEEAIKKGKYAELWPTTPQIGWSQLSELYRLCDNVLGKEMLHSIKRFYGV